MSDDPTANPGLTGNFDVIAGAPYWGRSSVVPRHVLFTDVRADFFRIVVFYFAFSTPANFVSATTLEVFTFPRALFWSGNRNGLSR